MATKKTFEKSLATLEEITSDLENGALSLDDSLKKFSEGIKLADFCNKKLDEAQAQIDILQHKDGEITREPFVAQEET
jgi:exodeoxyribonuclease VII small subunit